MSWEAVTWANKQRLKKSYEQIVLLVLANAADPNGEAFVKWPGRDHWWAYLSDLTRLPKSSLFRHLNTLMALGLGERSMLVLADGSRRPTFTLNMSTTFDIDDPADQARYNALFVKASAENESPVETEHPDDEMGDENANDISHSHGTEADGERQSPVETEDSCDAIPSPETGSFPVLGTHRDSLQSSKDSPLPPSGGLPAVDELFDEFTGAWRDPIPKMALARSAWDHIETAKRAEVLASARGYWAWLKAHPKPPSAVSAQAFLRDAAGWAQWLRYTPGEGAPPASVQRQYPIESSEGRAIRTLYGIAGLSGFLQGVMIRNGLVSYLLPVGPRLVKLAEAGPKDGWVVLTRQQAGAWESFLRETVSTQNRRPLCEGGSAPWPWPPSKNGTIYHDQDPASPEEPDHA